MDIWIGNIQNEKEIRLKQKENKASMNGGVCVRCECETLVFYSENYVDYYCHNCGRRIDWSDIENNYSEFIRKHEEMLKKVAKLLDGIMEDEDEET